jgi:hypothetical protein
MDSTTSPPTAYLYHLGAGYNALIFQVAFIGFKQKILSSTRGRKDHFRGTTSIYWTLLTSTLITPTNIRVSL